MKILFLGGNFDLPGGTERVASIVANEFVQHGHDVIVASVQGGKKPFFELNEKVKVKSLFPLVGKNILRSPLIVVKTRRLLKEEKVDVLIVVESMLVLYTMPAVVGINIKHLCWEHFNFKIDLGRKARHVARLLAARFCDAVVTLTERDREFWLAGTNSNAKIFTIPNPSPFPAQQNSLSNRQNRIVLGVGRLVAQKGFDLLLASWQKINRAAPEWRLRIVGDGPDKQALEDFSSKLGIEDSVEFISSTNDIAAHYKEADIFCLSSRFEGFGMVLVEAMSFGIPVVSFDCEVGPSEILEGTGSILISDGDVSGFGDAVLRLIYNPQERERITELSLIRALEYQPERIVHKWISLLE